MTPLERAMKATQEVLEAYAVTAEDQRLVARAVLQAIREPSEGMAQAGVQGGAYAGEWPGTTDADDLTAAHTIWQAMIDAALKEG